MAGRSKRTAYTAAKIYVRDHRSTLNPMVEVTISNQVMAEEDLREMSDFLLEEADRMSNRKFLTQESPAQKAKPTEPIRRKPEV